MCTDSGQPCTLVHRIHVTFASCVGRCCWCYPCEPPPAQMSALLTLEPQQTRLLSMLRREVLPTSARTHKTLGRLLVVQCKLCRIAPATKSSIAMCAHLQLQQTRAEDALEEKLGFPLFTDGEDKLGWLTNIQPVSVRRLPRPKELLLFRKSTQFGKSEATLQP